MEKAEKSSDEYREDDEGVHCECKSIFGEGKGGLEVGLYTFGAMTDFKLVFPLYFKRASPLYFNLLF